MKQNMKFSDTKTFLSAFLHYVALGQKQRFCWCFLLLSGSVLQAEKNRTNTRTNNSVRPNILLIMADDMGFSDLGCYGSEIQTPHLDRLAKGGIRFTQFTNTARCWPTRAALLTGYYAQQVRRDTLPGLRRGNRPGWAPLVAKLLSDANYRCYHSGKWHLDGMPLENGFHHSYYLKDQGRFFNPKVHYKDDRKLPVVKPGSDYYGTVAIADHAIECLQEHQEQHDSQPFFHYVAFTAPHFPLHALPEDIVKYQKTYHAGWNQIRASRWKRIQSLGIVRGELSKVETNVGPPYHFPEALTILGEGEINRPRPWSELTEMQKMFQATKMSLHAAMIDRIDQEVGRILQQLQKMKRFENTLILFLSDNGASAEIMVRSDGHDSSAIPGSAASYLCLGPGWSTVSNTPFRRHKTWVHEGGISTPLIAHWSRGIENPGSLCHQTGHVIDVVPTILDLTGTTHPPATANAKCPPLPGRSFLKSLTSQKERNKPSDPNRLLWWSHEENRAIRKGEWKLVAPKDEPWELYRLSDDPTETHDLSREFPEKVKELQLEWEAKAISFRKLHQSSK